MLGIGCHLSSSNGYLAMGKTAISIGANTFQFFTRNPRGSKAKALDVNDAQALNDLLHENHFAPILAHAAYTMNPASGDKRIREFAKIAMSDDLERLKSFPGALYNFHPGSHTGDGTKTGIERISSLLSELIDDKTETTVLLETMAGKGSEIGASFEELRSIINKTAHNEKLGVCLDTCHIYDAGYDIKSDLDGVLAKFDDIIGLERLKAVHLNDSANSFSSHKDRHAGIGKGSLGFDTFAKIINHDKLRGLPFYLETPNDLEGYAREIALLREVYSQQY